MQGATLGRQRRALPPPKSVDAQSGEVTGEEGRGEVAGGRSARAMKGGERRGPALRCHGSRAGEAWRVVDVPHRLGDGAGRGRGSRGSWCWIPGSARGLVGPRPCLAPGDVPGRGWRQSWRRGGCCGHACGRRKGVGWRGGEDDTRRVVGEHPGKVGVRGDGAREDAPGGGRVVDAPASGRRAGAVPVKRDEGGGGRGRPGLRRRGVPVAGGTAE